MKNSEIDYDILTVNEDRRHEKSDYNTQPKHTISDRKETKNKAAPAEGLLKQADGNENEYILRFKSKSSQLMTSQLKMADKISSHSEEQSSTAINAPTINVDQKQRSQIGPLTMDKPLHLEVFYGGVKSVLLYLMKTIVLMKTQCDAGVDQKVQELQVQDALQSQDTGRFKNRSASQLKNLCEVLKAMVKNRDRMKEEGRSDKAEKNRKQYDVSLMSLSLVITSFINHGKKHRKSSELSGLINALSHPQGCIIYHAFSSGKHITDPKISIDEPPGIMSKVCGESTVDTDFSQAHGSLDHTSHNRSDETEQSGAAEMQNDSQTATGEPGSFSVQPESPSRDTATEEEEMPNVLNEQIYQSNEYRTSGVSFHQPSETDLSSIQDDQLTDHLSGSHHLTLPKTFPELQMESEFREIVSSDSLFQHVDDLRTDGASDTSSADTHDGIAEPFDQNVPEMIQENTTEAPNQSSPVMMFGDSCSIGSEQEDSTSIPRSVRVHTPVPVDSPTSSGPVSQEYGYSLVLSESFVDTFTHHSPPHEIPPVLTETRLSHSGDIVCHADVYTAVQVSSEIDFSFSTAERTSLATNHEAFRSIAGSGAFPEWASFAASSQAPASLVQGSQTPTLRFASTQEPATESSPQHSEDQTQVFRENVISAAGTSPSSWEEETRDRNERGDSAPIRLPPITVHAAGALPPWAAQTARIDLSQADNRPLAPLRKRRATYDDDWPDHSGIDPANMALAGFYRIGSGRRVRCFFCGLQLEQLTSADNIWTEHVRHEPSCVYLRAVMGEDRVLQTQSTLNIRDY